MDDVIKWDYANYYKSINLVLIDCNNIHIPFEIQFHTIASITIKELMLSKLYDIYRYIKDHRVFESATHLFRLLILSIGNVIPNPLINKKYIINFNTIYIILVYTEEFLTIMPRPRNLKDYNLVDKMITTISELKEIVMEKNMTIKDRFLDKLKSSIENKKINLEKTLEQYKFIPFNQNKEDFLKVSKGDYKFINFTF